MSRRFSPGSPSRRALHAAGLALLLIGPGVVAARGESAASARDAELDLGARGCVACHAASEEVAARILPRQAPILADAGARVTPGHLRRLIASPQEARPGSAMPALLDALPEEERGEALEDLVHFVASLREGPDNPGEVEADVYEVERGRRLYHRVGCVACHEPFDPPPEAVEELPPEPAADAPGAAEVQPAAELAGDAISVPFHDLARRTSVRALARFLEDPLRERPSGRMPSLRLTPDEARMIAVYLLREQLGDPGAPGRELAAGIGYQYFEGDFRSVLDMLDRQPRATGTLPTIRIDKRARDDQFGFIFTGLLRIGAPGRHTFWLASDDGSRLWLGDGLLIDNDGIHAPEERHATIELAAGDHPIRVAFFEQGGGEELRVEYAGPGIARRPIPEGALLHLGRPMRPLDNAPFTVDPQRAARGRARFERIGCAACHALSPDGRSGPAPLGARPLLDLDPRAARGCLAVEPGPFAPRFALSAAERARLSGAIAALQAHPMPLAPAERVDRTLRALRCLACHERGGITGPAASRRPYFTPSVEADMGDEGRLPPRLDGVGRKLRPAWLRSVLVDGASVRPYMGARMPRFGEANVAALVEAFEEADRTADIPEAPPGGDGAASDEAVEAGRMLVGVKGLSCITCHTFGSFRSLGIPALDLTTVTARLREEWFRAYLLEPQRLRPGTRMPEFWPNGRAVRQEVLGGDTEAQVEAIWRYLSKGTSARVPVGLKLEGMELLPIEEPRIYRNFLRDVGARGIAVGYPEMVHAIFDADGMRWAEAWRGRYLDPSQHWGGRGDGFIGPLGDDRITLVAGCAFAVLPDPQAAWPEATGKAAGYAFRGYRLDAARRPTFRYDLGGLRVEDSLVPFEDVTPPGLRRVLLVRGAHPGEGLRHRIARGARIEEEPPGSGVFRVDGRLKVRVVDAGGARPALRRQGGSVELLLPVLFQDGQARIEEVLEW